MHVIPHVFAPVHNLDRQTSHVNYKQNVKNNTPDNNENMCSMFKFIQIKSQTDLLLVTNIR